MEHNSTPALKFVPQPQYAQERKRSDNSEWYSPGTKQRERVFITQIHVTDIVSGLHRIPTGIYVTVKIDGKTTKTPNKPILVGKDMVEWDEEIILPSERSSIISLKVYASFELGTGRGNGTLLCRFKTTVGDVLDRHEELQPIKFLDENVLSSRSSLKVIAERRIYDINESPTRIDLPASDAVNQLAQLTDTGRHALLRYRQRQNQKDLDEAITCFEHVQDICPPDHPNHSVVLFNLATAKFVHCQDNNHYHDLDVAITLYQDALQLRTSNHSDHCMTALDFCFALLARFQSQRNKVDRKGSKDLLFGVVERYAYRAAWFALQMAGISVSIRTVQSGISRVERANPDDEELIRRGRAMLLDLPDRDPRRLTVLGGLGSVLVRRLHGNGDLVHIQEAILILEQAVRLIPDGHPDKPAFLDNLGGLLLRRFERLDYSDLTEIDKSVSMHKKALHLTPDGHPNKPALFNNLGTSLLSRFRGYGDLADIDKSISMFEETVGLTPNGHPDKPARLNNLGYSLSRRFVRLGDLADIDKSVSMGEEAVRLTPNGHPDKPSFLNDLGDSLFRRFERLGDLADINRSISMFEEAVCLTPNGHPSKQARLNNLGSSLFRRFERLGDLTDIDKSISMGEDVMRLTPNGHPDTPAFLNNLGSLLFRRFERLGDLADLEKSILMKEEVVGLTPNGHPDKPAQLNDLGSSLFRRFERLGDLTDLNKSIEMGEEAVRLTPDGHPDKPARLNNLGSSLLSRFERLGDLTDLDKSILMGEEAEHLIPHGHPGKPASLNSLGSSLSRRFERLGDLADIDKSISIFQEEVRLTPNSHPAKPTLLNNLGSSLFRRFQRLGDLADIDKSISIHQEAMSLTPNGHPDKPCRLNNLGNSLLSRFNRLGDLTDIDKSISMEEEAVGLTPVGHPEKPAWLSNLGFSLSRRFQHLGDLADINKSISTFEVAVALTPNGHPEKPARLNNLGFSLCRRFERLGDLADIDKSISIQEEAMNLTPNDHPEKPGRLNDLGSSLFRRFERLGDPADIDKSISMGEEAVRLSPSGDPAMPVWLNNLGNSLSRRFQRLGALADIAKSISVLEQAVHLTPNGHPAQPAWLNNLGSAFMGCFERSRNPSDLSAATLYFSVASHSSAGPTSARFRAAHGWISSARLEGNSQAVLDAYTTTINLLPQLAWLGLPLAERHHVLLEAADIARDAAAVALDAGCPDMAVGWLEQGRSIVWSQFLQLRTPVDELRVEHPALANQFHQISRQLEHTSSRSNDSATDTRPLEEEVQRHHDLALRREKLLVEIQSLPGFDQFLLPKTIEQLTALANSGPVVYLNASKQRCDALIVEAKLGSAIPVPLPGTGYQEMVFLQSVLRLSLERNRLIISRDDISALIRSERNPVSRQFLDLLLAEDGIEGIDRAVRVRPQRIAGYTPDDLLQLILAYLWNEVVKPVLQALGFSAPPSGAEKMAHIFWCPTGPFAFLPIHAAGLYNTADAGAKLSDFAISSYIPTLSALTSPAQKDLKGPSNIHLTAVPQPPTDGLSGLVSVKDEMDHIRMLSAGSPFVTLQDSHGTIEDVMEKLKNTDWVHFACHGVQDPENPLDSGLCLANGRRLKLSDIIRLSRPQGGLAFLSACQTAQGDEDLSEESVHLAAGMLLAGYGGVIATMWAIRDADAPKVTKDVYEYLFRDGKVPDSTEAAEALHYAVQHLRDSGASFTSWIPFIHVGR